MKIHTQNNFEIIIIPKRIIFLSLNYLYDAITYFTNSGVFNHNTQRKIEGKITFYYHSIEKGLVNDPIRYRFGAYKIRKLINFLNIWIHREYDTKNSQFISACSVLVKYYLFHSENQIDISEIIEEKEYEVFKIYHDEKVGGFINYSSDNYFQKSNAKFDLFSASRHSVRHFNGELIPNSIIEEVVRIAKNAPSVCNRQSVAVKLVSNKVLIDKVLNLQSGLNSSANTVNQLFVVSSDRNYFLSEYERNQLFIDGGIYLLNLLYSIHFHHIAACPLHCAIDFRKEIKIKKLLKLNPSEKIIAFVAVGYPKQSFKVPYSERKKISEIFDVIN